MDPQLDARLTAIEQKLDETTTILRKMRKSQQQAAWIKAAYWIVIIVLGFGSIFLIKPYLGQLGAAYGIGGDDQDAPTNTPQDSFLDQLKQFQKDNQ